MQTHLIRLIIPLIILSSSITGSAADCPRKLEEREINRYFTLLDKYDKYLLELSLSPQGCDSDRHPDDCDSGTTHMDPSSLASAIALTDDESNELQSLEFQIKLQAYFDHSHKPLSESEYKRKAVLEEALGKQFAIGNIANKRRMEIELEQLKRRLWNALSRAKNDDILRRILQNEPFPYGTRILENGTVILGEYSIPMTFGWRYWSSNSECPKSFEADCNIGRSNEAARVK